MNFIWKDYSFEYAEKIEDFLDKEAFKYTSCEDGFNNFYTYWHNELGENSFCKLCLNQCAMNYQNRRKRNNIISIYSTYQSLKFWRCLDL